MAKIGCGESMNVDFKTAVEMEMERQGVTQAELARRLNTSRSALCQKLKREWKAEFMMEILKALGVKLTAHTGEKVYKIIP